MNKTRNILLKGVTGYSQERDLNTFDYSELGINFDKSIWVDMKNKYNLKFEDDLDNGKEQPKQKTSK